MQQAKPAALCFRATSAAKSHHQQIGWYCPFQDFVARLNSAIAVGQVYSKPIAGYLATTGDQNYRIEDRW